MFCTPPISLMMPQGLNMQKFHLNTALLGLCFAISHSSNALASTDEKLERFISLSLEDLISLETTIATASKRTASKAPAVISVITADDLKATGATNLTDALQNVPGIHVRTDAFGNRPLVHFRGANATQTLLMVNGNSMRDLVWGFGIFWKGIPVSAIERIEIIRGPGSALFGADAIAGAINVITKTAGQIKHSEAGVRTGSFNTRTAWIQHGDNWQGIEIGFTAELYDTEGYNPLIAVDRQAAFEDQTYASSATLSPDNAQYGWRNQDIRFSAAKDHWRLQTDYTRRSDLEIGLTGFGVLDPVTRGSDERFNLDLFYNNDTLSEHWTLDTELRFQHLYYSSGNGFQERPPGYTDSTGTYPDGLLNINRSSERSVIFEVSTLYSGIKDHSIRLGGGHTSQDLYSVKHLQNFGTAPDGSDIIAGSPLVDLSDSPYAFAPEKIRHISQFFLEDTWGFAPGWELTAGARYDDYSDFGSTTNPRLALVWQTTNQLTSKLIYGQAFRAPSYQELFVETSRALPNPDLDPERSETLDLAFSYSATKNWLVNLNLFYFDQTDLISLITVAGQPKTQFQNTSNYTVRGVELETHWQASKQLNISANYTQRNPDSSSAAIQEAKKEAYFRTDWKLSARWNWNIQASWTGERLRGENDSRNALTSYTIADTTLRYAQSNAWEFAVSIRNLFDKDASEFTGRSIPGDLPLAERNAYAEARYKF